MCRICVRIELTCLQHAQRTRSVHAAAARLEKAQIGMLVRRPMPRTKARSKSGTANQAVGAAKQAAAQFHPKFAKDDAVVFRDSSGNEHRGSIVSSQQVGSYHEGSDFEYQVVLTNGSNRGVLESKLQKEAAAAGSDSEEGSEDDAVAPACSGMTFRRGTVHAGDLPLLRKYMTEDGDVTQGWSRSCS
jgi:hypothetical protein